MSPSLNFDLDFKFISRKRNLCTLTPSYLGNVSVATVTMAVNSPEPTILCFIMLCVCLSSLYDQYFPFLLFFVLFVIILAVVIAIRNHLLGMYWLVVIPLVTIISLPVGESGVGGVSFVQLSPLIRRHNRLVRSRQESPIWKGLVCCNNSGHYRLPPGWRRGRVWSVISRVSFVQHSRIFC